MNYMKHAWLAQLENTEQKYLQCYFLPISTFMHVSVSDLYFPRTSVPTVYPILLQLNRQTDPGIAQRYVNAGTGNEVAQFHLCEYINRIFGTVQETHNGNLKYFNFYGRFELFCT
jgi:hypothetical protein